MWDTSERLLKLLSLLQLQGSWSSDALCKELSVTSRTISRDIVRLRNLGYPVTTTKGLGGGYSLEKGAVLPPIMFNLEEATAVLLALRLSPTSKTTGRVDAATALEKLHYAMPKPLKAATQALATHSTSLDLGNLVTDEAPDTDAGTLLLLSRSCRDRRQVTCTYQHHNGHTRPRRIEPLHLVHTMNRWYLIAYCTQDEDWSILRVDRISDPELSPHSAHARQPPAENLDEYVSRAVSAGWQQVTATVRVHAPRANIMHWISPAWGTVTEETSRTCIVRAGADSYDAIARWLLLTTAEITVLTPPELAHAFQDIANQAQRTADS
ncbi:WYL domain-containing protein [Arthrobacter sp. UYCu712]|uniref:helix-turn-helix transcriptional regulator n=1 Tax=Arthrobacter sp. UYCu712 TaxID=3156340 RepID=UPI00339A663F